MFGPFSRIFRYFFGISGPNRGGFWICFFAIFRISGTRGFLGSVPPAQDRNLPSFLFLLSPLHLSLHPISRNGWLKAVLIEQVRHLPSNFKRKQKGGFVNGRFWRMFPRYGFCIFALFFVPSFQFFVPSFLFLYPRSAFGCPGTSTKTTLLETTLLRAPDKVINTDSC